MAAKTLHNVVQLGSSESRSWLASIKMDTLSNVKRRSPQYESINHHPIVSSLRSRHVRV